MLPKFLHQRERPKAQDGGSLCGDKVAASYVFTIKKSGTHLLRNILEQLGMSCVDRLDYGAPSIQEPWLNNRDTFVLSHELPSRHWRASCQSGHGKIMMNLRDPRAVFLSLLDFYDWERPLSAKDMHTVEFRRQACRSAFKDREALGLALLEDELLDDDPFTPWLNFRRARTLFHHPGVLKIRYEECFPDKQGAEHGGENVVVRICRYLGRPIPEEPAALMKCALDEPSLTKNVARPDRWHTELSPQLLRAFMDKHGDLVREFGYPEG
jgi:hypothetical protein